ncbi:MAG: helix-turn-helix domain-containing protein [Chitinophagaceae bacterium]|nr:helix-turn-helix domain-containing protein [Microcystis sp. M27BS1]MCA6440227.1 helix-turn-helix domain-containing protein [Chitinophagaceae bacterium]MCA6460104.1 helix-turn-helix domain-containing protein [Chitinophagaceae bacterium]MCA6463199.1 helix-turn-helix domain-containing protein [Chitinophagaceae bacterium]
MSQIILNGVTLSQLLEKIEQLIDRKLNNSAPPTNTLNQSKFYSRQEVARLLMISLPTLRDYTKSGWLVSYKIGNRVLYKQEEVLACVERVAAHKFKRGGNHGA